MKLLLVVLVPLVVGIVLLLIEHKIIVPNSTPSAPATEPPARVKSASGTVAPVALQSSTAQTSWYVGTWAFDVARTVEALQQNRPTGFFGSKELEDMKRMLSGAFVELDESSGRIINPRPFTVFEQRNGTQVPKYGANALVEFTIAARSESLALPTTKRQSTLGPGSESKMSAIHKTPEGLTIVGTDPVPVFTGAQVQWMDAPTTLFLIRRQ